MFCAGLSMLPPESFGAKRQSPNWLSYCTTNRGPGGVLRAATVRERFPQSLSTQASRTAGSFVPHLIALGYPAFRHMGASRCRAAPATLLLQALWQPDLDARVCEALPWVARQYAAKVDWEWLVRQAKLHDFQNRLGFLLELAGTATGPMAQAKSLLEAARLLAEATLCWDSMRS